MEKLVSKALQRDLEEIMDNRDRLFQKLKQELRVKLGMGKRDEESMEEELNEVVIEEFKLRYGSMI